MAQSQFSLSWDAHTKNICSGLSSLQQNGEFVDMTLAADGHHVKVHQIIIALASPYIKELMSSVQCSHPVIFLNKMSYSTLSLILEYIYTGEVMVSMENLKDLVEAGKELQIKGLEDMKLHQTLSSHKQVTQGGVSMKMEEEHIDEDICYFEIAGTKDDDDDNENSTVYTTNNTIMGNIDRTDSLVEFENTPMGDEDDTQDGDNATADKVSTVVEKSAIDSSTVSVRQYTVSNQGSLQMILNRFVYYLKHSNRNGTRQWRCVDYLSSTRCPARVVTLEDAVVQRVSAHTHTFHDKKILKKVQNGAIFTAIQEAMREGESKKYTIQMINLSKKLKSTNDSANVSSE